MAVEIRELVIRAVVKDGQDLSRSAIKELPGSDQQALIEECVKQVLKILKRKQDR